MKLDKNGTIIEGYHEAADDAMFYLNNLGHGKLFVYLESFSSCAIENNILAKVCSETLYRVLHGKSVSDRYLLGLAWTIRNMEDKRNGNKKSSSGKG